MTIRGSDGVSPLLLKLLSRVIRLVAICKLSITPSIHGWSSPHPHCGKRIVPLPPRTKRPPAHARHHTSVTTQAYDRHGHCTPTIAPPVPPSQQLDHGSTESAASHSRDGTVIDPQVHGGVCQQSAEATRVGVSWLLARVICRQVRVTLLSPHHRCGAGRGVVRATLSDPRLPVSIHASVWSLHPDGQRGVSQRVHTNLTVTDVMVHVVAWQGDELVVLTRCGPAAGIHCASRSLT